MGIIAFINRLFTPVDIKLMRNFNTLLNAQKTETAKSSTTAIHSETSRYRDEKLNEIVTLAEQIRELRVRYHTGIAGEMLPPDNSKVKSFYSRWNDAKLQSESARLHTLLQFINEGLESGRLIQE